MAAVTGIWIIRARKLWRPLLLAGAMLTGVILAQVITRLVERPRPPMDLMVLGADSTYSFPSGHVLGASDFLLVGAFLVFSRRRRLGAVIAGFSAAVAGIATQAISRLYLGYHWLTDVLASVSLSLIVLAAVIALTRGEPPRSCPGLRRWLEKARLTDARISPTSPLIDFRTRSELVLVHERSNSITKVRPVFQDPNASPAFQDPDVVPVV